MKEQKGVYTWNSMDELPKEDGYYIVCMAKQRGYYNFETNTQVYEDGWDFFFPELLFENENNDGTSIWLDENYGYCLVTEMSEVKDGHLKLMAWCDPPKIDPPEFAIQEIKELTH